MDENPCGHPQPFICIKVIRLCGVCKGKGGAVQRASYSREKWQRTVAGWVRGSVGVSLAAWYWVLAVMAKLGI